MPHSSSGLPALGTPCLCCSLNSPSPSELGQLLCHTEPSQNVAGRLAQLFPGSHPSKAGTHVSCVSVRGLGLQGVLWQQS